MLPIATHRFVSRSTASVVGLISLASLVGASAAIATNPGDADSVAVKASDLADQESLSRMIDDRRAQLHDRKTQLSEAIDELGGNHPSVNVMQEELREVQQQLAVWSSSTETLVDIDDHDLRVLVVQLIIRVDQLESKNREQQFDKQGSQGSQRQFSGGRPRSKPRPR